METRKIVSAALGAAFAFSGTVAVAAEAAKDYPNRPIRLIMPNAPGSSTDTMGRIVGGKLGERLGHVGCLDCDVFVSPNSPPVVIDLNPRIGGGLPFSHMAGANLATALVAWRQGEIPPDGALAPRPNVHVAKYDDFVVVD